MSTEEMTQDLNDELNGTAHDPENKGGNGPRKQFLEEYSDIPNELDEPHPFEIHKIHARKAVKTFNGSEPKEVTELVFVLGLIDDNGEFLKDAETGKIFALEYPVNKPKPSSYEFFKNTGLFKFFDKLKLTITEDLYMKSYKLGNFKGARGRLMVDIVEGVSKRTGKPYRVAKLNTMNAPKDKEGTERNKKLFDAVFE